MEAGRLNKKVTFQRNVTAADGGGGTTISWRNEVTVWGNLREERGRERLEAGRLEGAMAGVLTVRWSSQTRFIDEAYRVSVDTVPYQIRSVANPDSRNRFLEFLVERGVGT